MFLIVIYRFVLACRAVVLRQPLVVSWLRGRLPRCDSPTRPRLTYHKFPRRLADADEIHALWQVGNVNLLGFSGDVA